jgi:hypothetical protein
VSGAHSGRARRRALQQRPLPTAVSLAPQRRTAWVPLRQMRPSQRLTLKQLRGAVEPHRVPLTRPHLRLAREIGR